MTGRMRTWVRRTSGLLLFVAGCATARPTLLPGFAESPHYNEQVKTCTFEPGITVHFNAPPASAFDPDRPTCVVLYALPNGNTIPQTIGCRQQADLDWHFFIQHIGAQTRRLREVLTDRNLVIAYVEAEGRSWPQWCRKHADSGRHIEALIDFLRSTFPARNTTVVLAAHSGGGSLIFTYLNHVDQLPDWIERIVLLDANYNYSDERRHGDKLLAWLQRSPHHYLGLIAYDDRRVEINGKPVVSPTGGTYRRAQDLVVRLRDDVALSEERTPARTRYRGLEGRSDIVLIENPENRILHTVLVERNGFIHALTFGTPLEDQAGQLMGPIAYEQWIQPAPEAL